MTVFPSDAASHRPSGDTSRVHPLQAFLPNRQITGDRAVAEWVVRAPHGAHLALTASADRAGTVGTEVTLD